MDTGDWEPFFPLLVQVGTATLDLLFASKVLGHACVANTANDYMTHIDEGAPDLLRRMVIGESPDSIWDRFDPSFRDAWTDLYRSRMSAAMTAAMHGT